MQRSIHFDLILIPKLDLGNQTSYFCGIYFLNVEVSGIYLSRVCSVAFTLIIVLIPKLQLGNQKIEYQGFRPVFWQQLKRLHSIF